LSVSVKVDLRWRSGRETYYSTANPRDWIALLSAILGAFMALFWTSRFYQLVAQGTYRAPVRLRQEGSWIFHRLSGRGDSYHSIGRLACVCSCRRGVAVDGMSAFVRYRLTALLHWPGICRGMIVFRVLQGLAWRGPDPLALCLIPGPSFQPRGPSQGMAMLSPLRPYSRLDRPTIGGLANGEIRLGSTFFYINVVPGLLH